MGQKDKFEHWKEELQIEIKELKKETAEPFQIVVSILPTKTSPMYARLKEFLLK